MKNLIYILAFSIVTFNGYTVYAQEEEAPEEDQVVRPMFESAYLMNNQSVLVYPEKTLEMIMQHRFGTMENGLDDFFGLYGTTNIRLGVNYVPFKNLSVGYGITKNKMHHDFNIKYAIVQQTRSGSMPVSLTYYGNTAIDGREEEDITYYANSTDRISFYSELIIARKVSSKFAIQLSPSYSHFNAAPAKEEDGEIIAEKNNDHLAVAVNGKYKVSSQGSITIGVNQPITVHYSGNPNPNIAFGYEVSTSSHAFQVFFGNYKGIVPQVNNYENDNTEFVIGFNITRLWSF
ncbi:MAG: hypothetical protein GY816_05665 [Cytophagales bacterium]|nr:hypothetical protein [Cytophagales bacterium]